MDITSHAVSIPVSLQEVEGILKDVKRGNTLVFGKPNPGLFKRFEIVSSSPDVITISVRFGKFNYSGIISSKGEARSEVKLTMGAWVLIILGLLLASRGLKYREYGWLVAGALFLSFFFLTRMAAVFWMNHLIKQTAVGVSILFPK